MNPVVDHVCVWEGSPSLGRAGFGCGDGLPSSVSRTLVSAAARVAMEHRHFFAGSCCTVNTSWKQNDVVQGHRLEGLVTTSGGVQGAAGGTPSVRITSNISLLFPRLGQESESRCGAIPNPGGTPASL